MKTFEKQKHKPLSPLTNLIDKSSVKYQIQSFLAKALRQVFQVELEPEGITLEHPADKSFGDYATNIAMVLAKDLKESPKDVAQKLQRVIGRMENASDILALVKVAGPGFVNFYLSSDFLLNQVSQILKGRDGYGSLGVGVGKVAVFDYSSPNIAKPFGVGHLRSTIIGQALYNIFSFLGYETIGDNHLGDWGTQFGKLIYAIKEWSSLSQLSSMSVKDLVGLYVRFHKEAELDPSLDDKGRAWFRKLEEGDGEARAIWKECVSISMNEFQRIYDLLGVNIDYSLGESFYGDKMQSIIDEAVRLSIARQSEGALIIDVGEGMPPLLLRKSDGATTYHTRDLATIRYRQERFGPVDLMIYETGEDHALHFRQLFTAARKFSWGRGVQYKHVAHGMMRLPEGKMSTRKGKYILLDEVLLEAIDRVGGIVQARSSDLTQKEREKIARVVGIGAVKYNDLKKHYTTNVVFNWDEILSLEGNSGPYLQYTYARAKSIVRKSSVGVLSKLSFISPKSSAFSEPDEMALLREIYKFPEIVREAAESYAPSLVCNFLFELAQKFNTFYQKIPVLKAETGELRHLRLLMTMATAQVIKNGLGLLGIDVLEEM